jgi:hypothetical protein
MIMKKLTCLLLLTTALLAPAQIQHIFIGSSPDDHSGELIGRNTWKKLNYDFDFLQTEITNAAPAAAMLPATLVKTSTLTNWLATNGFVFTGSNNLGWFTNVYQFTTSAGTNALTNIMTLDGVTWTPFYFTNKILSSLATNVVCVPVVTNWIQVTNIGGTNYNVASGWATNWICTTSTYPMYSVAPVELAVLAGHTSTGAVTVAGISDASLIGHYNSFAGQTFDFGNASVLFDPVFTNLSGARFKLVVNATTNGFLFVPAAP